MNLSSASRFVFSALNTGEGYPRWCLFLHGDMPGRQATSATAAAVVLLSVTPPQEPCSFLSSTSLWKVPPRTPTNSTGNHPDDWQSHSACRADVRTLKGTNISIWEFNRLGRLWRRHNLKEHRSAYSGMIYYRFREAVQRYCENIKLDCISIAFPAQEYTFLCSDISLYMSSITITEVDAYNPNRIIHN